MTGPKPRALVLLAPGAEEMEVVITADVLRRGGIEVVLAGLDGPTAVRCSRGVTLVPDAGLDEVTGAWDAIVLPGGGPGSDRLAASPEVAALLHDQEQSGRLIAAICAAPKALVAHGIGAGRRLTSHPSVREQVAAHGDYVEEPVVEDGNLITSRGPGTAFAFALALVARLRGKEVADGLRGPMLLA